MRASIEPVVAPVVGQDIGGLAGVGMGIADYGAWIAIGVVMLALAGLARWSMTPTRRIDPADERREDPPTAHLPAGDDRPASHLRVPPAPRRVRPRGGTRRAGTRAVGHEHLRGHRGAGSARRRPGRPGRPGRR